MALQWEKLAEKEILDALRAAEPKMTEKRMAAYEKGPREAKKAALVIPENETREMTLTAEPGIDLVTILQKPNSRLSLSYLQNLPPEQNTFLFLRLILEAGAHAETFTALIGGESANLFLETRLDGEGSALKERTLYFGGDTQEFTMFSKSILNGRGSSARVNSKGVLFGRAQGRFDGNIHIAQSGHGSEARLTEHTLLLSPEAKMSAIPGLKIDTNDVVASHNAGITRVQEDELFFCQSRGIEEREAVRLITEGFLNELYKGHAIESKLKPIIESKICSM